MCVLNVPDYAHHQQHKQGEEQCKINTFQIVPTHSLANTLALKRKTNIFV